MVPGMASLNTGVHDWRGLWLRLAPRRGAVRVTPAGVLSLLPRETPPYRRRTAQPCTAVPSDAPGRTPPHSAPRRRSARAGMGLSRARALAGAAAVPSPSVTLSGDGERHPDSLSGCAAAEPPGAGSAHLVVVKNNLFPSPFGEGEGENHSGGGEGRERERKKGGKKE